MCMPATRPRMTRMASTARSGLTAAPWGRGRSPGSGPGASIVPSCMGPCMGQATRQNFEQTYIPTLYPDPAHTCGYSTVQDSQDFHLCARRNALVFIDTPNLPLTQLEQWNGN